MARVLVAGCGYLGTATADLFHDSGWIVEGWTSSPESARRLSKPYRVKDVDIRDPSAVAANAADFDVVIDCVSSKGGTAAEYRGLYLEGARNLLDCVRTGRFIFTSSTAVYGQTDGSWVLETSAAEPASETARVLRETEEMVLEPGGVVVRVAGIFGPGRSFMLRNVLSGRAIMDDGGARYVNQVHRDDVAAALFLLAKAPLIAAPRLINVVDDRPMPQRECYEWLARRLGLDAPDYLPRPGGSRRGRTNKRVSNSKLHELGWRPAYPSFAEAMERSIIPSFLGTGPPVGDQTPV